MSELLLDADVLIWYLRGKPAICAKIDALHNSNVVFSCCSLTVLEILRGMKQHETKATKALLDSLYHYPVTDEIIESAYQFYEQFQRKGFTMPFIDSINAAIADTNNILLWTHNTKHYPKHLLYQP